MDILLPVLYLLMLAGQAVLLIFAIRRPTVRRWGFLLGLELLSLTAALLLAYHYNGLPGFGIMPGLTYFAETLFSMFAALVYGGMMLISALCALLVFIRRRNSH